MTSRHDCASRDEPFARQAWLSAIGLAAVLVALLAARPTPAAAQSSVTDELSVEITPAVVDVTLGESVEVVVAVTNRGPTPTNELAVHIDITDPLSRGSVDPEDWTATLTRRAGVVEPGATVTVAWNLQPISGGDFVVYAVALSPDNTDVHATSHAIDFSVASQRTLNPQGVLPIAIAMPVALGALLVIQWRRPLLSRRSAERASG